MKTNNYKSEINNNKKRINEVEELYAAATAESANYLLQLQQEQKQTQQQQLLLDYNNLIIIKREIFTFKRLNHNPTINRRASSNRSALNANHHQLAANQSAHSRRTKKSTTLSYNLHFK